MDLSGVWSFSQEDNLEFSKPDYDHSNWKTMQLPRNWFLGGLDHHGVVWFRHIFNYKKSRKLASLHFDGIDYFSDIYLNGGNLGHHSGYFEPFAFEISDNLNSGRNILAVRVESPYEQPGIDGWHINKRLIKGVLNHHDCRPGGGWNISGQSYNTGGIWNRVHIEEHGLATIDQMFLRSNQAAGSLFLHVELRIQNWANDRQDILEINCVPDNFKGKSGKFKSTIKIPMGISNHSFQMPVPDIHLWQPWDRGFPYLYKVSAFLSSEKRNVPCCHFFGFRSVKVEDGFRWLLNGNPYFIRGSNYLPTQWLSESLFPQVSQADEHPFGGGPGGDLFTRDVDLAKQANLNMLRVHAHVLPHEFHEACDRAGMLVWQDFPLQWGYTDEQDFQMEAEYQIKAMVSILYNHPSIVAWCCHNESPCDAPWMAGTIDGFYDPNHNRDLDTRLETAVRKLDSTRYIHRNSGTDDGHVYPGWYVGEYRDFHNIPGAPFITEYGAQGLPIKENIQRMLPELGPDAGHSDLVRFKGWLDSVQRISPFKKASIEFGGRIWNFIEKAHWKSIQNWIKGWGMKLERSTYKILPPIEDTPADYMHSREVWSTWQFHDFQPAETFDNHIQPGFSLDEFITNSQVYQSCLIQFATECYRREKYNKVTGIIQFDFTDPWPSVTWSVLDYWRSPKPSYYALQRSMQLVLPSFIFPNRIDEGKAILTSFIVVNDSLEEYSGAICDWRLLNENGDIASATFLVNIPPDGISTQVRLTLPSLGPGKYELRVVLFSGRKIIGENSYSFKVDSHQRRKSRLVS